MKPVLSPSILSADFTELGDQLRKLAQAGMEWVHVDVMDGHFVPNITIGPLVVEAVRRAVPDVSLDVHLMIEDPARYTEPFIEAGADILYVHAEADHHLDRLINRIRELGARPGVSLNPATPIHVMDYILPLVDTVLVMSVNPGFGGQSFIPYCMQKIEMLDRIRRENGLSYSIAVDGGIHQQNIEGVARAGSDLMVAGSAVFRGDCVQNFRTLNGILQDLR